MTAGHSIPAGERRSHRAFVAMWTSIAASAVVALLVTGGWSDRTWGIAVGLLAVSCVAVCVWAGLATDRSNREVELLAADLAEKRKAARR